ncbi:helix-turn-helix domain-containing protein [Lutibacter sp.]|uniref:helix-turn-helix domain-containing protein n=1 Tax=Lutibacter sp. TaxID=1925666 RepID=UPI0035640D79
MKSVINIYKNIDKSTQCIFHESGTFKIFHLNNLSDNHEFLQHSLNDNYIQIYFCCKNECTIAFNAEHCAIKLIEDGSNMVYFKDEKMNLFFNLSPNTELIAILISIEHFHSLFSINGNALFNYNSLKSENPIIEPKEINPTIKLILNQLRTRQTNELLRPIYLKGKVYELLSYYFSESSEKESENCPYVSNEEIASKLKQAKKLIVLKMNNPPSLSNLAKEVGLNIKKLKTGFKEVYGVPVFVFLLNYKMELAKTLLQEQQMNVNEIASHLGYSASSHFIAAFKKKFGITPKQFAKS